MEKILAFFSSNQSVQAFANVFGIVAGCIIIWKFVAIAFIFLKNIYNNNIITAIRLLKRNNVKIHIRSARDIHFYISKTIQAMFIGILSTTAVVLNSVAQIQNSDILLKNAYTSQTYFSSFEDYKYNYQIISAIANVISIVLLLISSFVIMNLSVNVMRIRRRLQRRGRLT